MKMKATGIVRRIDDLGRIGIPKEIRKSLRIEEKTSVEIFTDGDFIFLQRYTPGCVLCGEMESTRKVKEKLLCQGCIADMLENNGE